MTFEEYREWYIQHEGKRTFPYYDSVGKLTIGIGRNLDGNGLSDEEINILFENDIKRVKKDLDKCYWYTNQPHVVKQALENMCFNLGFGGLLKFKRMIAALAEHNYDLAADEALNSKWAKQVKGRAVELADMIRSAAE